MFRKPCKMNVSSAFKKHVSRLYGGFSASHCILMFLNEKSRLLFVIGFQSLTIHTYMMLVVSNCLSNVINYI